ncbi:TIR domain-containing protein [Tenacibaculum finnmarkense]|uniref:Thoeris protein ThsB TIR-like domain-containing protein n=2 Tax=Tenacibaculum finnmarkense TaxID=2781243 RepID=A0A2I2M7E1_9FLAO|nr:TIR domain-containing protein [Tenacibaculum finnmarkense]MBE7653361.1 TIR domain-containing protein [Tenacibaculum finnmarkense genomovar finnmarkense]MBE7660358.1 TIR domain-containing protein [Tenacibaculum finnmarkense genomovar finnmarkense]MBE7695661.1 TIR domain-containing protein [Tenacibaculum finnmarkense genomovar finnmarkense]MBE7698174.1 TIR domain-containing protein [Tenacibaculum finnmarkense genomovar ulcerans]MCD8427678.1 TIR domain-containing protein [Tenacibaculum finnmar
MEKGNNVFISHYGKDDDKVQRLKERFAESNYKVRNYSVDSTKHTERKRPSKEVIERLLRRQISWSGSFICLIGDKTHTRPWVDYEIKEAIKQNKKIIGVYAHGSKETAELPVGLKKYGVATIGWNSIDRLVDIMNEKEIPQETPSGTEREPLYQMEKIKC